MNPYSIMVGDTAIACEPHTQRDPVTGETNHVAVGDRGVVDHVEYSETDDHGNQEVYVGVSYGPVYVNYCTDDFDRPRFPERGDGWLLRCPNLQCLSRRRDKPEAPSFSVYAECGADGVLTPIDEPAHLYTCQHCGAGAEKA